MLGGISPAYQKILAALPDQDARERFEYDVSVAVDEGRLAEFLLERCRELKLDCEQQD